VSAHLDDLPEVPHAVRRVSAIRPRVLEPVLMLHQYLRVVLLEPAEIVAVCSVRAPYGSGSVASSRCCVSNAGLATD
jgi:hypothetical protein